MPGAQFCSHCGENMSGERSSGWITAARVLSVITLVFIACPAGAFGGCALIIAVSDKARLQDVLLAISMLGLSGASIWFVVWAFGRR